VLHEEYQQLCTQLKDEGIERVALCGVDGSAETAWLSLQEAGIEVSLVMDISRVGTRFMKHDVVSLAHALLSGMHCIMISSCHRADELYHALLDLGVEPASINVPAVFLEKKYAP
jgi:hypothetical protein